MNNKPKQFDSNTKNSQPLPTTHVKTGPSKFISSNRPALTSHLSQSLKFREPLEQAEVREFRATTTKKK